MNSIQENPDNLHISIDVIKGIAGNTFAEYVKEWMMGHRKISSKNLLFLASCSDNEDLEQLQKKIILPQKK
jgi:hypothetical protein